MRLGHRRGLDGTALPFAEAEGRRIDLAALPSARDLATIDDLIADWDNRSAGLLADLDRAVAAGAGTPIDLCQRLAPPVLHPRKVFGVGFNYLDHAREFGTEVPVKPNVFAIAASSIIGHGDPIAINAELSQEIDWEAELAVVIGRHLSQVSPEEALAGVFGYTICNDVTARDLQRSESQWSRAKGFDGSHPLGPVVVTVDEISDPQALRISLGLNDVLMQDGTSADMVFTVAQLIAFISEAITLEPGDVIATGTPPGVGAFRTPPVFLTDTDVVSIEVERIGRLENPCLAVHRAAVL